MSNCRKDNVVLLYDILQGNNPGAASRIRNINFRLLRIENNSNQKCGIAIDLVDGSIPKSPTVFLKPKETVNLSINGVSGKHQQLYVFNAFGKISNVPRPIKNYVNCLIINKGVNGWWVNEYHWKAQSFA